MADPTITDDDAGYITAAVYGKEVRAWSYGDDDERRRKMVIAHEFAEGWFLARRETLDRLNSKIGARLNNHLCEMKEGYDDSIIGFNEAWDIVRQIFAGEAAKQDSSLEPAEA